MAKCVKCGAELSEGARFCRNCGARVEVPALKPEAAAEKQKELEATALGLRELSDKMIASFVTGMKDLEGSLEAVRKEAEAKVAEAEKKFADRASRLMAKEREFSELSEKFGKLQTINQQLQTDKLDAQTEIASLKAQIASLQAAITPQAPAPDSSGESK